MAAFGGLLMTNKGRNLQAKVQAGAALHYTRIGIGSGQLGGSSIADLTALKTPVISLNLDGLKVLTGGKASITGTLSNQDVTAGFYYRELGIFATDPDEGEILYCYGNSGNNAEYIPAGGGADVVQKRIEVIVITGNAANVTAEIADGVFIPATEKAQAGGVATLGGGGKVPVAQLPMGSLSQSGIAQLSSAVDSVAEDRAATSKAVKVAFERGSEGVSAAAAAQAAAKAAQAKADAALPSAAADRAPMVATEVDGTAAAIELTVQGWPAVLPRYAGVVFSPTADASNPTISINGGEVVPVVGRVKAGKPVMLRYDSGSFFNSEGGLEVNEKGQRQIIAFKQIQAGEPVVLMLKNDQYTAISDNLPGTDEVWPASGECVVNLSGVPHVFFVGHDIHSPYGFYIGCKKWNPTSKTWTHVSHIYMVANINRWCRLYITKHASAGVEGVFCAITSGVMTSGFYGTETCYFDGTTFVNKKTFSATQNRGSLSVASYDGKIFMSRIEGYDSGSSSDNTLRVRYTTDLGSTWAEIFTSGGLNGGMLNVMDSDLYLVFGRLTNGQYTTFVQKLVAGTFQAIAQTLPNGRGIPSKTAVFKNELLLFDDGMAMTQNSYYSYYSGAIEERRFALSATSFTMVRGLCVFPVENELYTAHLPYNEYNISVVIGRLDNATKTFLPIAQSAFPLSYTIWSGNTYNESLAHGILSDDKFCLFSNAATGNVMTSNLQFLSWQDGYAIPAYATREDLEDAGLITNSIRGIALKDTEANQSGNIVTI